jgi:hypothetical protein
MPYFELDKPNNNLERKLNESFWRFFKEISENYIEVYRNDLPNEMTNSFRRYGAINQFNQNYHYFKVMIGTPTNPKYESHRYRTQIISAFLEREYDLDFEIHHYSQIKDELGKYDDTRVYVIYGQTKGEVKRIHQTFHNNPINSSLRIRGEIR